MSVGIEAKIYMDSAGEPRLTLTGQKIHSLKVSEKLRESGLPLGCLLTTRVRLEFEAGGENLTPALLDGARLTLRLQNGSIWSELATVYITDTRAEENGHHTVTAVDRLTLLSGARFTDSASAYPRTLKNLVQTLCAGFGVTLGPQSFLNDSLRISSRPDWGDGAYLGRTLERAAFAAGGFARMSRGGELEIVPCGAEASQSFTPSGYTAFIPCGGSAFSLHTLLFRHAGDSSYTRYADSSGLADSPSRSLRAEGNPLCTAAVLRGLVSALSGCGGESGILAYGGFPLVQAGDRVSVTDKSGAVHSLLLTQNEITLTAAGLSCVCKAMMPSSAETADVSASRGICNADGTLRFEAIGDAALKILALDRAYIESLSAAEITALGLTAKLIDAVSLRAQGILASSVETDALTAAAAEIVNASVRRLDADSVTSDVLTAALANALAVKAESLTSSDLTTDRLAAALARLQVLTAGNASFDRATVTHLVSSALNLTYGTGDKVFIRNLTADYASLLRADVGNLTVKAADGNYYRLNVDAAGAVSALPVTVTASEAQSGVTDGGNSILETNLTVAQLSADNIQGVYALINRLDAARLDVDTLWARQAFIDALNTRDITSNSYLRLAIGELSEALGESEPILQNLKNWLTFDESGLRQGKSGSAFSTLINASGFHIRREGSIGDVGSFDKNGLSAPGMTLGSVRVNTTGRGGWVWTEV